MSTGSRRARRIMQQIGLAIGLYHDLALAADRCGSIFGHTASTMSPVPGRLRRVLAEGAGLGFSASQLARTQVDGYRLFAESIRRIVNTAERESITRCDFSPFLIRKGNDDTSVCPRLCGYMI
jgi:hypothetical protein